MSQDNNRQEAGWYVVHTYSGYENKVKNTLETIVEKRNLQDRILEISVPTEQVVEVKNGKRKVYDRKLYPGYVLVKLVLDDDIWYIVRNTRGVTGFVGPSSTHPVALSDEEQLVMGLSTDWVPDVDYEPGDSVKIVTGPLDGSTGKVLEIDKEKSKVLVNVYMLGREMPVEFDFTQILKE